MVKFIPPVIFLLALSVPLPAQPAVTLQIERRRIRVSEATKIKISVFGLNELRQAGMDDLYLKVENNAPSVAALSVPVPGLPFISIPLDWNKVSPDGSLQVDLVGIGLNPGLYTITANLLEGRVSDAVQEPIPGQSECSTTPMGLTVICSHCNEQDQEQSPDENPKSTSDNILDNLEKLRKDLGCEKPLTEEQLRELKEKMEELARHIRVFDGPMTKKKVSELKKFNRALDELLDYAEELLKGKDPECVEYLLRGHRIFYWQMDAIREALERKWLESVAFRDSTLTFDMNDNSSGVLELDFISVALGIVGVDLEIYEDAEIKIENNDEGCTMEFTPGSTRIDFDDAHFLGIHFSGPCLPSDIWVREIILSGGNMEVIGTTQQKGDDLVRYVLDGKEVKVYHKCATCDGWRFVNGWDLQDCGKKIEPPGK